MKPSDINPKNFPTNASQVANIADLAKRVSDIEALYGKPFKVTSGLRSMEDHIRIYKAKGITDVDKIPMKSKHLYGQAVDISDPNKELQAWCLKHIEHLKDHGLWCEDFSATPNWVHFQSVAPASGKRFFKP